MHALYSILYTLIRNGGHIIRIGIPGGLLYYRYEKFITGFFDTLGADTVYSVNANKKILDKGINCCIDEACLPMKIFHGHAADLKDKCDALLIPRIMNCEYGESICPKFSGLPEMVRSGIGNKKIIKSYPIYLNNKRKLVKALVKTCKEMGFKENNVIKAYNAALYRQKSACRGISETGYKHRIFLAGHTYNIYDSFANMDLINKLHQLNIGVVTEEILDRDLIFSELKDLIKNPYWLFFRNNYGASKIFIRGRQIDGIIYVSSFCCGIDSFAVEMIKNSINDFPMLVLKLDEQTGEAGFNTRLEAFSEMLERRKKN